MFQITVVNKTGAAFDPVLMHETVQSGNKEAGMIIDSANGLTGAPSTKLLNGRESTYKVAYSVTNANDIVMEFTPDFTHDAVIFTS